MDDFEMTYFPSIWLEITLSYVQGWIRLEKLSVLFSLYVQGNRNDIEMQIHTDMNFKTDK